MTEEPTPHARIWLTPPCCGNYEHGEVMWCEDAANECGGCGASPTEYVLATPVTAAAPDLLAAAKRSLQGWDNAIELAIILPQHRNAATILADELRAAIAKATAQQEG